MLSSPLVSLVLLNFNGKFLLETFTPSIAAQGYPHCEVIFVDNASHDGSCEWIQVNFPHWKIIRNSVNLGTAEGWNIGARVAEGDLIFSISTDMWFEPDCVSKLVKRFQADPLIGICGCKIRRITQELKKLPVLEPIGNLIDFMGFPIPIGQGEEDKGQHDLIDEVFFSLSGAMMIRKSVFEMTGGFDSGMFTMVEDADLSWRIRLLGYKVCIEPTALLYHLVSATVNLNNRGQIRFWSERNTLRMLLKNYSLITLVWVFPCYLFFLFAELSFYIVLRRWDIGSRVLGAFKANVVSFKEIRKLRRPIQKTRKITDKEIFKFIRIRSGKLILGLDFLKNPHDKKWENFFSPPAIKRM